MPRYEKPRAGEWVQPSMALYKLGCCDCGLVHRMQFRIVSVARKPGPVKKVRRTLKSGRVLKIHFRAWRDERATAAMRRGKKRGSEK